MAKLDIPFLNTLAKALIELIKKLPIDKLTQGQIFNIVVDILIIILGVIFAVILREGTLLNFSMFLLSFTFCVGCYWYTKITSTYLKNHK